MKKRWGKAGRILVLLLPFVFCAGAVRLGAYAGECRELKADMEALRLKNEQLEEEIREYEDREKEDAGYGALSVSGTQLCGETGEPVRLKGISSHGLAWYPEYTNYHSLKTLREYGANVFRIAIYPAQNDGYLEKPELNEKLLYSAVENSLAAGLYTIVDWHVLRDENPLYHLKEAGEFFENVSGRYGNNDKIIYEICNEPNGDTTYEDISEYAGQIIPVIRKNAPDAVILVGMPGFCTTLDEAVENPLPFENIMYTYHYYSHISDCRYAKSQINNAISNGIPVFVSEWGFDFSSDTLEKDAVAMQEFMDFLDNNNISWVNWSLSSKEEAYSFINPGVEALWGWEKEQLSPSGQYVAGLLGKESSIGLFLK